MAVNAQELPSGSWRCRAVDPVTHKVKSFTTKIKGPRGRRLIEAEANAWLAERHDELEHPRFRFAAEEYIAAKVPVLSPTTISGYETYLKNNMDRIADVPLEDITPRLVQDWVNELTVTKSAKTVHNVYGFFTAVLNFHDIKLNLGKVTLPRKVKRFKLLPKAEVVLELFCGTDIEIPVLCAVWGGMRISEILGMRAGDIVDGVLTINQTLITVKGREVVKKSAKTYDSTRQLRLPRPVTDLIEAQGLAPDERIVQLNRKQVYGRFKKLMKGAGYGITFHDLRHINASVMAALGIPDIYAMERGGWSNTTTLRTVYQQTFTDERQKVDAQIDGYFMELYRAYNKEYVTDFDTEDEKLNNSAV